MVSKTAYIGEAEIHDMIKEVRKRDGENTQPFNIAKLKNAIKAAMTSCGVEDVRIATAVLNTTLASLSDEVVDVETIQDAVETSFMRHKQFAAAKAYILYRHQRAEARQDRAAQRGVDPTAVSNYIHAGKYARYVPDLKRREVYDETVARVEQMHVGRFPDLKEEITRAFDLVRAKRLLPSMRSMQFGGDAILQNNCRIYNCASTHIDRLDAFSEALFLLLSGCGVGYSVQFDHVDKLPIIPYVDATKIRHHVVKDTIEGWADALKALLYSYQDGVYLELAYNRVRPAGTPLVTSGGRAPGHRMLKVALEAIRGVLDSVQGRRLRPIECHRIMCHAADAVLSGGIRRCLPKGTLVHTEGGLVPIEDIKVGTKVRTSGVGHDAWSTVSDVLEQGVQALMHVNTQMGTFKCTAKHRMAVMTSPTTYDFKMAQDLKAGDRLIFVDHVVPGTNTQLPTWSYIRREADNTSVDIQIPELDADVAWFLGYLHGDGYVHVNRKDDSGGNHFVALAMNDLDPLTPELVRRAHNVFSRFGVASTDYAVKGENTRVVRASGKQLALYLEGVKLPKTPLRVPDFILRGTQEIRSAYLAGLLDSDGGAKNRPVLLVSSVYPEFIQQVQTLYASLGVVTRLVMNREARGNWQALYHLNLVGDLPREAFQRSVGTYAVKSVTEEYTSQRDYGFPREWVLESGLPFGTKWSPTSKQMTLATFDRCGGKRNELTPITVFGVEASDEVSETYDLTVDGAHEFVAEGLLVHNSAMISLFSLEDSEMMNCKTGNWFTREPWLANANNSVALKRDDVRKKQFKRIFKMTKEFGEPGFYFTDDLNYTTNPCAEISMNPRICVDATMQAKLADAGIKVDIGSEHSGYSFCNLVEINAAQLTSLEDFMEVAKAATLIGTLQATYTDMPYLGWASTEITKRDALLGVGMTGMLDAPAISCHPEYQRKVAEGIKEWNAEFAARLGINSAARTTCVKPSGTTSLALGCVASGHHAHHARRYIRRVTADPLEFMFQAFKAVNPHMCVRKPDGKFIIEFPVEAPEGATVKSDIQALSFLDMIRSTQQNWVIPGTERTTGNPGLHHNVSNTVTVKSDEWDKVADYLWENREFFTGVSLLADTGDKDYAFSPMEEVVTEADEARWNAILASYKPVDYASLVEDHDATNLTSEAACAGGACSIV